MICKFKGCQRLGQPKRGFCKVHWTQFRRTGEMWPLRGKDAWYQTRCHFKDCPEPHLNQGYCRKHRNEKALPGRKACSVPGCGTAHSARGFCGRHYMIERIGRVAEDHENQCAFEGCILISSALGFCVAHYMLYRAYKQAA